MNFWRKLGERDNTSKMALGLERLWDSQRMMADLKSLVKNRGAVSSFTIKLEAIAEFVQQYEDLPNDDWFEMSFWVRESGQIGVKVS